MGRKIKKLISDDEIEITAEKMFWKERPTSTNTYDDAFNRPKLYGFKLGAKWAREIINKRNNG